MKLLTPWLRVMPRSVVQKVIFTISSQEKMKPNTRLTSNVKCTGPVSYTHLDVYKRQKLLRTKLVINDNTFQQLGSFRYLVCNYGSNIGPEVNRFV